MAFDYPEAPVEGQIFSPPGGPSYVWHAPAWELLTTNVASYIYIGDAPPVSPVVGQQWWRSSDGNTYLYFDDGNSRQWVQI